MRLEIPNMIEPGDGGALPPLNKDIISEDLIFITGEDGAFNLHKGHFHCNGCFYAHVRGSISLAACAPDTRIETVPELPIVKAWAFVRSVRIVED
jgi:hypothetical protein